MPELAIPDEGQYGDIERDFIDNEPPGLFPGDQNSYWGQARKVFADSLQVLADQLSAWYDNLDPRTVDENDIGYWEEEYGIPVNPAGLSLEMRRGFLIIRTEKGPFTRARRARIIEWFIRATFGPVLSLTPDGLPLLPGGLSLYSGEDSLVGLYSVVEDIPNFHYQVRLKDTLSLDVGLVRELDRVTPDGITFDIVYVASP